MPLDSTSYKGNDTLNLSSNDQIGHACNDEMNKLCQKFIDNFVRFDVDPAIVATGPQLT